jgi:hypothetical protein
MIYISQLIYIRDGQQEVFHRFEDILANVGVPPKS